MGPSETLGCSRLNPEPKPYPFPPRNRTPLMEPNMPDNFDFKRGYLLACTNMMNLHGDSVIARDTLNQVNITEAEVKAMDLAEYDAEGLAEIRAESHGDPIRP